MFGPNFGADLDGAVSIVRLCKITTYFGPLVCFLERQPVTAIFLLDFGPRECTFAAGLIHNDVEDNNCKTGKFCHLAPVCERFPDLERVGIVLE